MDLTRGFAAILIVIVHVGLYLSNSTVSGLYVFCDIVGSEPCAPVLMVLMGISMVYSHRNKPADILRRGIHLFINGYVLNIFRSLLPLLIFGNIDRWASVEAFFVVDILQLAGLSFMLIALLKKLKLPGIAILGVALAMVAVDEFIMLPDTIPWSSKVLTGIVDLFCPLTEWSCFPLLTWFVFPAFGLFFGEVLIHCKNKNLLYGILLPVSLCGTVYVYYTMYSLYPNYTDYYLGNNFYYMGLRNVLLTFLIALFFLSFWFFAGKILPKRIKNILGFLSKNLNPYYIVSWFIISLMIHLQTLFGWSFGTWTTVALMALLVVVCVVLAKLWAFVKVKIKKAKGGGA